MILLILSAATMALPQEGKKADTVPNQRVVFAELRGAVDGLFSDIKVWNDEERAQLSGLWDDMTRHRSVLERFSREHAIPAEYRSSLVDDTEILTDVARGKTQPDETLQLCQDVAEDLKIKSAYARRSSPFDPIVATIYTKSGTKQVTGLVVCYVKKGLLKRTDKHKTFDKQSSPTSTILPPGNYVMWTRRGKDCGEQKTVNLGEDGQEKKSIDLGVPAE